MGGVGGLRFPPVVTVGLLAAFLAVGALGVRSYGLNYWLYRGFAPPHDPPSITAQGTSEHIDVASPALGGRSQSVYVYLPPGYSDSTRRYPVVYLLHGFPGRPLAFLQTLRMGVVVDETVARSARNAAILVMPSGSTGTFTDEEWANGVSRGNGWLTFVARDLVHAIDARYRTIAAARGRAIAGLSEGGYGAINIALHNPREFSVVESWSGYERPDKIRSIFGKHLQRLAANDPMTTLPRVSRRLRHDGTYFWLYSGNDDPLQKQNRAFASELARLHVSYRYFTSFGGHNWGLWRKNAVSAYLTAVRRLAHA